MNIALYRWAETDEKTKARIMRRAQADIAAVHDVVKPIIADVKQRGDDALKHYAKKFEGADVENIKATPEEFDAAEGRLEEDLKTAIKHCIQNVKTFHVKQMERVEGRWLEEIEPGVWAGEHVTPIESVGLYVPRGKGAFPSSMFMLSVPAVIAGVENIAVITPPTPEGTVDAAALYTAQLCGIENVYKCGGAQGVAALAYGTETVPKVAKVLGPGSPYVQAAKQLLFTELDPGMPASSSEAIVLADGSADPDNTILDILNEAEHGEDSAGLLVTHDEKLAKYVQENMTAVINALPQPHRDICAHVMGEGAESYGGIILTESLQDSIAFTNDYAPEHLHLKVENPDAVLDDLKHAGEILIGEYTPSSLGNYGIGVNHVLPTGGKAKSYSCTSVWDFLKRTSLSRCDRQGFENLKDSVITMTDYEGFPAHGDVLRKRKI